MDIEIEIVKVPEHGRYEVRRGGQMVGLAEFHQVGDVVVVPHTEVDRSLRGQGVAGRLVAFVLDDVRSQGLTVDPQCWYVAEYLQRHPEYADVDAR